VRHDVNVYDPATTDRARARLSDRDACLHAHRPPD
jgi:hypothetical protein